MLKTAHFQNVKPVFWRTIAQGLLLFAVFLLLPLATHAAVVELHGWAWSSNIGWVGFNCADASACGSSNYKVLFDNVSGNLTGEAWSSSIGWIRFNPSDTPPGTPTTPARVTMATGAVTGWIRACSVYASGCSGVLKSNTARGGWDGWIKMSGTNHTSPNLTGNGGVTYDAADGRFIGFAWGGDVVGWLRFCAANETDFCVTVSSLPPDLDVTAGPSVKSGSLAPGNPITFQGTVTNIGGSTAGGTFANRFLIDLDSPTFTTADVIRSGDSITALASGASSVVDSDAGPWTAVVGTHTLRLLADDPSSVVESNEANNGSDWTFTVSASPTLSVTLSAVPSSGTAPLNTNLTADVTGSATGNINYSFWWHCPSYVDPTPTVGEATAACGALSADAPGGGCTPNAVGTKCDAEPSASMTVPHTYATDGTYYPLVIAERGVAPADMDSATVVVAANSPPVAINPNHPGLAVGTTHTHTGATATDANNNLASYSWAWVSCPGACPALSGNVSGSISGGASPVSVPGPTYTPAVIGDYVLQLSVTDDVSLVDTDNGTDTVVSGGGGSFSLSCADTIIYYPGLPNTTPDTDPPCDIVVNFSPALTSKSTTATFTIAPAGGFSSNVTFDVLNVFNGWPAGAPVTLIGFQEVYNDVVISNYQENGPSYNPVDFSIRVNSLEADPDNDRLFTVRMRATGGAQTVDFDLRLTLKATGPGFGEE